MKSLIAATIDSKKLSGSPWREVSEDVQKKKELQYHQLINLSPEAIMVYADGKLVYVNQSAVTLMGAKSSRELMGLPILEIIHPDFIDAVINRINKIFTSGKYVPMLEEKFLRLDGVPIEVEVISLPFEYKGQSSIMLIVKDITQRKKLEIRQKFLEKISNTLFVSFNETLTLKKVARLIVPEIADYCRIVTVNSKGDIKEIAVNHKDPKKITLATQLYEAYKNNKPTHGVLQILRTRKAELITKIDDQMLKEHKTSKKLVNIIHKLRLKSYMGVPLIARNKIIGAIIFSSVKPNRYYTKDDLSFAQEIGRRVAIALDNSRLYSDAQEEIKIRKHTEERLQLAQTIGHIGTFEWDLKARRLFWSKEQEELYGLAPGSFSGKHEDWEKRVHPEDRKKVVAEVRKQRDTKKSTEYEYRIVRPDNTVRWLHTKSKVFFDNEGKPTRRVGMAADITEQKNIENNLRFLSESSKILSSSLDYQTTLNNVAKLAVPEIADWCSIDLLNEKRELQQLAVVHVDPEKVRWAKELRKTDPPQLDAKTGIAKVIRTGQSELYPVINNELITKNAKNKKQLKILKELQLSSVMIVPLYREGKCKGAISFVSAESKRHYNQNDLAMAKELAYRASLALDSAWLYKNAKDAIALRDDFISVASHELKTPVTSIKIFTGVLEQYCMMNGNENVLRLLLKMDKQVNKLTKLIYDLLNISKIQSGRLEFTQKYFDIDKMIKENIDVFQEGIKHKIYIRGKCDEKVYGDEDRISQVLINLLSNAVKYSPKSDKINIYVKKNTDNIEICVEDFGIGMSREHLNRVFERFYRVFDTTDKTFPGLGIGLYISNEIIKRHNGKLWVESRSGKGSRFYLSLPIGGELIRQ